MQLHEQNPEKILSLRTRSDSSGLHFLKRYRQTRLQTAMSRLLIINATLQRLFRKTKRVKWQSEVFCISNVRLKQHVAPYAEN